MVTPDYVRSLTGPTPHFLCHLTDNDKGIDFVSFRVRTLDPQHQGTNYGILFEVARPEGVPEPPVESLDDNSRFIRYHFGPEFLEYQSIGTMLEFTIGDEPLHNFMMIERHYFRDQLIQSFEFSLPFVIPGTKNTWEMMYTKPDLPQEWKDALIAYPWESRSDSFYFVEDRLVMHNRAEYNYAPKY